MIQLSCNFLDEMKFKVNSKSLTLGQFAKDYADVSLYIEEKDVFSILKANKVILALHSPYFHKLFQSSKDIQNFHIGFMGVSNFAIRDAIRLIYGENISITGKNVGRFSQFLKLLGIDFETDIDEQESPLPKKQKLDLTESLDEDKDLSTKEIELEGIEPLEKQLPCMNEMSARAMPKEKVPLSSKKEEEGLKTDETDEDENEERKQLHIPSLVSQPSVKITNRKGSPAFLDNWTETSESGLLESLEEVDFKIGGGNSKGQHQDYICCHCGLIVRAIAKAKGSKQNLSVYVFKTFLEFYRLISLSP